MKATETSNEMKSGHWFAERFSGRIDRLWLGGVALTNAAVWLLFDAKYIGLALIAYCFIFILTLRKRIKVAYPADADRKYDIGYAINWPNFNPNHTARYLWRWFFPLWCTSIVVSALLLFFLVFAADLEFQVIPTALVFFACNGFLLFRYRILFTACCGGGLLTDSSEIRVQRMLGQRRNGAFSMLRLLVTTCMFALAWGGMLFAYVTGQLGDESVFGWHADDWVTGLLSYMPALVFLPPILHLLFFETLTTVLRGWGDKP